MSIVRRGGGLNSYNNSKTVCYKSAYYGWKSPSSHHHQWHLTPPLVSLSLPEYAESFIYTHRITYTRCTGGWNPFSDSAGDDTGPHATTAPPPSMLSPTNRLRSTAPLLHNNNNNNNEYKEISVVTMPKHRDPSLFPSDRHRLGGVQDIKHWAHAR